MKPTEFDLVKDKIQSRWPKLTEQEVAQADSDFTQLAPILKQKYGISAADAKKTLSEITANFRRDLEREPNPDSLHVEQDGVRGTLRDQYRQF